MRNPSPSRKSADKRSAPTMRCHGIRCAVLLALGQATTAPAGAQSYINYDGSRTGDLNAAIATWASNAEFKSDWGLGAMNAQSAYALGFSGKGVKLGAVDSGLRLTHQEFAGKGAGAVAVAGSYANDGAQYQNGRQPWKAGDPFNTTGAKSALNDNHGSHVSGTIAAAKNGMGMMGVAFGSDYFITNSNGTDGSIYGVNMDYNYFKAAYGNLAAAGVRAINSSWGTPDSRDDYGSVDGLVAAYQRLEGGGKKSWLAAAADVALESNVLQVWAAGNAGKANVNVRSALPYFRPGLEQNWVAAAALNKDLTLASFSNQCGVAKYWCVSAPGVGISSLDSKSDIDYTASSGTSMAAPHVTGALGVLMERYPSLDNQAIRTILLTTAKHLGDGPIDAPNTKFGWGIPDLGKAMNGPGQFLGVFNAHLPTGISDVWRNDISEAALIQRKGEETEEMAAWPTRKAGLQAQLQAVPESRPPSDEFVAGMARAKELLQAAITANIQGVYTAAKLRAALQAVNADPIGKQLLAAYEQAHPGWTGPYSLPTDFDNFIAGRTDPALADDVINATRVAVIAGNAVVQGRIDLGQARIDGLQSKTAADYVGTLVKTGSGTLTLMGNNSYSGGTKLEGGTLGVGSSTALGAGALAMSDATTLQAAADGLQLANAITLSGTGAIDTQAFGLTLSGAIADGSTPGGLAKLGTGTLTLSGTSTYSGPTGVLSGTLRAGSATAFSARSAFFVDTQGQLDLGNASQTIGSLSGTGKVALGTATLTTGADNSVSAFSGQIDGGGSVAKTGSGTFTLAGANTYSGGTLLKAGRLNVGNSRALGTGTLAMDDGTTLGFAANGLSLANDIRLTGTQDPVIDTGAFTGILAGVISGTGLLTKNGTGSLITTGANTYSGATVVAEGRLQAGAAGTFSPASAIAVHTGATLDLAGYSQRIAGMTNAGTVSLLGHAPGTTLTVTGPWVGQNGLLKIGATLNGSNSAADRLVLSGQAAIASGSTTVHVTNDGGLGALTAGNGIEVIRTEQGGSIQANAFSLAGGHIDAGAYEYRLNTTASGGYLASSIPIAVNPAPVPSPGSEQVSAPVLRVPAYRSEAALFAALPSQIRRADLGMLGNMRLRIGDDEVRHASNDASPENQGLAGGNRRAWGRVISMDVDVRQGGMVSPTSKGRLSGFQAGTDLLALPNWRAGLYVGQLDGDVDVNGFASGVLNLGVGTNDLRSRFLGLYGTYRSDEGLYVDTVLQTGRHRYTLQPITGLQIAGKGRSTMASIEVGQPFALGASGWTVEPQLQLIRHHQSLDDANLAATRVQQRPDNGWIARAGVRLKGNVSTPMGPLQPYGRLNVYKTSRGTDVARFVTLAAVTDISSPIGSTSTELAGGFTLALNRSTDLYGEAGKLWASGGNAKTRSSINGSVGLRMRW